MKARNLIKTIPMKLYVLLAAVILFAFFSNDFGLVDIQKTAVILAAGVDRSEEGFTLTAQIAVPKGSDRSQGGTSSVEIDAEGKTISDCVSLIFSKTGWVPKLVFCDLIVIGENAAKEDVISYLNYFLRSEYMPDSCKLAVCEGTAKELLSSTSAIDDASSLAIDKLFSDAAEKSGNVMTNTLKDFAIGYYGASKSGYLPYIRMTDQDGSQDPAGGTGGTGGTGAQQSEKIYSAEETAIFSEGRMVGLLPREQTLAFSLLKGNVEAGTLNVPDRDETVTLSVLKNEGGIDLEMKGAPIAKLDLSVMVRLCCRGTTAPMQDISSDGVPDAILERAKTVLDGYVRDLWQICKESGCDLFDLRRALYRSSLKKYAEWKDYLLASVTPEIKTEVKSMK